MIEWRLQRLEHVLGALVAIRLKLLGVRELVQAVVHRLVLRTALEDHEQPLVLRARREARSDVVALGDRNVVELLAQFLRRPATKG